MHVREQNFVPRPFAATVAWRARAAVVCVEGEVDPGTAPRLRNLLDEIRGQGPQVIVIDLRQVTLLASAGLATLIAVHDQAFPDVPVRIVAPSTTPAMRSVLLTGLDELLVVHPTVDAALADTPTTDTLTTDTPSTDTPSTGAHAAGAHAADSLTDSTAAD